MNAGRISPFPASVGVSQTLCSAEFTAPPPMSFSQADSKAFLRKAGAYSSSKSPCPPGLRGCLTPTKLDGIAASAAWERQPVLVHQLTLSVSVPNT